MSNLRAKYSGSYFKPGSNNVWCQRCGKKVKVEQIKVEWDQLKVCNACYEERHPQDMLRGVLDHQAASLISPEPADKFTLPAIIQGLTTATLAAGPEDLFDDVNTFTVQLVSGALPSTTELGVLNGANIVAVQGANGWEVLQYTVASLIAPSTYSLTHLLRARYGTELGMGASAGSPFAFIGQASPSNDLFMRTYLGVGAKLFSPVSIAAARVGNAVTFSWVRRSRLPALQEFDWAVPLDSIDERYELDVLTAPGGAVVRTLRVTGAAQVAYSAALQTTDFGAPQARITVRVYQVDQIIGRGIGREATV
jgi:hypothetical protein